MIYNKKYSYKGGDMIKIILAIFTLILLSTLAMAEEKNVSKKENNSSLKEKSVGHVGGFAVSGRVSTIVEKPKKKPKKELQEANKTKK